MRPVSEITEAHLAYWSEFPQRSPRLFVAPPDLPTALPCPAIVTISVEDNGVEHPVVRVPIEPDDEERFKIMDGGRIWVSFWGGLPPHFVEVEAPTIPADGPRGATRIAAERWRQEHNEGHTPDHDDSHDKGELVLAAWSYLTENEAFGGDPCGDDPPDGWPWSPEDWKPATDPVRNLVKAGALIAAEIDRLQRTVTR